MWQLLPLFFGSLIAGGLGFLLWYEQLSHAEKLRVDRLAAQIAWEIFQKSLEELSFQERGRVYRETRSRFF